MKKNLRLLFLGLAAATFTCGFAQEDMTSSLKNADMELGLKGWSFDGTDYMGKHKKNPSSQVGFHGMNQGVQETWHANPENPLGDSYVMQRVKGLDAGTYVFGAYAGAAKQTKKQEKSNRDSISGVVLFANADTIAVATDNPDLAYKYEWAHSSKFNVATKVTDGKLLVGLKVKNTNANYVVWDNATLYYFGDMSETEALDAMAQIDMNNAVAIADTLVDEERNLKMQVDSLENLKEAIAEVKKTKTTADNLWDNLEVLFYNMGLARRSVSDYAGLLEQIEFAGYIKDSCEWSEDGKALYFGDFEEVLEDAQKAYDEAEADRAELTDLKNELARQIGWVRLDSFYTARQELQAFINSDNTFTDEAGKYTTAQKQMLMTYDNMLRDTLAVIEDPNNEDPRPQDLHPFIEEIYATIAEVKNNPFDGIVIWSKTLPRSTEALKGYKPLAGTEVVDDVFEYTSPLLEFDAPVEAIRLTVTTSASDAVFFTLSALELYDKDNNRIALDASALSSNADHNSLPGNGKDGDGLPALVDDNAGTYFHSDWGNKVSEPHYLQVLLPNGGYDALYFKMIARGASHVHQFPGEIIVTTPEVNHALNNLTAKLQEAKALEAYCGTDPGFFTGEEGPEFAELAAAILEGEALVANEEAASTDMTASRDRIHQAVQAYKLLDAEKNYHKIEAGKVYRIVSGFPGFFDNQGVEKALTVHSDSMQLWWENVCADSLQQEFVFEPILDADGEPYVEMNVIGKNEEGGDILEPIYCFNLKSVKYELYADSAFTGNPKSVKMVKEPLDTVKLKWLGRGQWNIMLKGNMLHCGDHNSGNPSTSKGAYGGVAGVGSRIVPWGGGIDGASAWFIREYPKLPLTLPVSGKEYKSDFVHFAASDSLTLTADAACEFDGLALYDLYGAPISFDVEVEGAVAAIKLEKVIPGCAFAFNNNESVANVTLENFVPEVVVEPVDMMAQLETKLESTLIVAPEQGTGVGQYDDITEYTTAVEAAEAMVENGAEADAEIKAMIAQLDSAVAHLKNPHLPEAGKYYFIVSGLSAFEEKLSYNVAFYPKNGELCWAQENELDSARCWVFEPATVAELSGVGLDSAAISKYLVVNGNDTTVNAYYIKNFGNGEYMGRIPKSEFATNAKIPMAYDKSSTVPYTVVMLGSGNAIGFDDVVNGQRLHALGHSGGNGKSGNTTYWHEKYETASAWRVIEVEDTDFIVNTEIDLIEVAPVKVVKGIYDLFGRRLDAANAPGIYIIDGVKRVIK